MFKDEGSRFEELTQLLAKAVDEIFAGDESEIDACFGLEELDLTDVEIGRLEDYRGMEKKNNGT